MGFDASMNNDDAFFVHAINQGFDALECGPSKKVQKMFRVLPPGSCRAS